MRVLSMLFTVFTLSAANQLLTTNYVENLFKKFAQNDLTNKKDISNFKEVLEFLHRPEYVSATPLEDVGPLRLSIDCIVCRSAFGALFSAIRDGQTDEEAADVITVLCIGLGIESVAVCQGAVGLNMPIIAHIIREQPEATPEAFCGLILQNSNNRNTCPFNDPRFEWHVDLPAKGDIPPPVIDFSNRPLKVAIITDTHIDPLYEEYGVADCDEPVCCRKGQKPKDTSSQSTADDKILRKGMDLSVAPAIKRNKGSSSHQSRRDSAPAGFWGDYRNCDTPIRAYDDAVEHIHEHHKDIDVIYYVGDTIDHGVWQTSYELINFMNAYLVQKLRNTFGDNVLVIPAIGNHEAQPTNQFAPSSVVGEKLNTTWLYKALVDKWGFYLPDEAKQTFLEQGDFSLVIRPGLRVISINNNVAYRDNWWLVYDPTDSKKHLDWLVRELHKAEQAGEKVHILAHIPPGVADLTYTWTREYNRIVNRFTDTIAAEFNGHTHADEFKLFYNSVDAPANVAWGAGGVTAFTSYNLNYKIATFNGQTFAPERFLNYVYNLTEANLTPNRRPHWFLLYDFQNTFNLDDLSPESINNLIYTMASDRRKLDLYSAFTSKLSDARWPSCNDNCKIDHLCRTVITVLWERDRCDDLRNIYFNSRQAIIKV